MKNKSSRHKETNIFKFQPFSERISNLEINVFHRVKHEYETQKEETATLFYETIQKWSVLNLSEGFAQFMKEVNTELLITYPQLLHNKEKVVEVLLKYLKNKDVMYLQPLLELTSALAEDLRKEFYPYYPKFLNILIELLHVKDAEQIEWVFTCLAYIFKYLWRPLSKDITTVFKSVLPLLSDNKPEYINNFAAESFSFVARKVRDQGAFLGLILKVIQTNMNSLEGCGKLLFEIMHGTNKQFHSFAETFLPLLFNSLSDNRNPTDVLFKVMEEVISNMLKHISPQKSELFWNTIIATLNKLQTELHEGLRQKINDIENVLKLLGQAVEHGGGVFLLDPRALVKQILKLLDINEPPETLLKLIVEISVILLLGKKLRLSQEQASSLTRKILAIDKEDVYLYFIDNVTNYTSFEALVLPHFLKYCLSVKLNGKSLYILTKLILRKSTFVDDGIKLSAWEKYQIEFPRNKEETSSVLLRFLHLENLENINDTENCICTLICLPHVNLAAIMVREKLEIIYTFLTQSLSCQDLTDKDKKKLLFLLLCTVQCLLHLSLEDVIDFEKLLDIVLPLCGNINFISALKILDLCLTAMKNKMNVINMETLFKINIALEKNFGSPYHEVRILTAHIYTLFENLPYFQQHCSKEEWKIFSICYAVESIDPQVDTYKDQLQQLEKLSFEKSQASLCKQTPFQYVPLRYLCSLLSVNFQLLWDPVSKLIATYGQGLKVNDFWPIFGEEVKAVTNFIKVLPEIKTIRLFDSSQKFMEDLFEQVYLVKTRPDFFNYRFLLWRAMAMFPQVAEAKTRDTSVLLLQFIEEEYASSCSDFATTWNIRSRSIKDSTDTEENNIETEMVEVENTEKTLNESKMYEEKAESVLVPRNTLKNKQRTLQAFLTVFSKISSPKSLYREPDLQKLYYELLSHKSPEIQKLALDCLSTYRHEYLLPYRDYLYNLIDEKNFKNELVAFSVDKENAVVREEHRNDLMPIIIKIVFSKMTAKVGTKTSKSSGQLRRNLVIRFLAGCYENEMMHFLQIAFRFYNKYLKDNPAVIIKEVNDCCNLEKFIPPKRLQSSTNLLKMIVEQFGGHMGADLLKYVLKVLFIIGAHIKYAFSNILSVHSGYKDALKKIRSTCINVLEEFYNRFDKYQWTSEELNVAFDVFIWPYLDKLETESIHSPTALLKLIMHWGSNPRYFALLVKLKDGTNQHILQHVVNLLINKKSQPSVCKSLMEMIENLLKLENEKEENSQLPVGNVLHVPEDVSLHMQELNYGSLIIMPYVPFILQKIKYKLENNKKGLSPVELSVLSRISELVRESDLSEAVLKLLLPLFSKRCHSSEENVLKYVTTVNNLIENIAEPQKHLQQLTPLYGEVSFKSSRKVLCTLLEKISNKSDDDKYKVTAKIIMGLNAWDDKWIDQPNFEERVSTFKSVGKMIDTGALELELGMLVIYNCFYTLRYENDLSLKENAAHYWKHVATILLQRYPGKSQHILDENLFGIIYKGIKGKNYEMRNECILFLGHLSRECPENHFILKQLHKLTNKNDIEVDFFENITHLQIHRHVRALVKFVQTFKDEKDIPNPKMLIRFIFPLASWYLCNEKYANKNSLIDSAIEAIGKICKLLPWQHYETLLKLFLKRLRHRNDYQKQLVRVTVAILDAFHYDLSKGYAEQIIEENNKVNEEIVEEVKEAIETDKTNADQQENTDKSEDEDDLQDDESEETEVVDDVETSNRIIVLSRSVAIRAINCIQKVLLPQLHNSLAEYISYDSTHKINKKKVTSEKEEEDLLKVPISLALVKLLQKLPKTILDKNLPGVFMKLATFLKSHLESVRRVARETFEKIMCTVGPKYLSVFLEILQPLLSKGFQVHVLVYTMHGVLASLKNTFQPGDIDEVVLKIVDICKIDLFGNVAEEKEIEKIRVKTPEAKSTRSYETFQILAQYITEKCLMDLLLPLKDILITSRSFKSLQKLQECLRCIALGLVENTFVSPESLMKFAYGTVSESIPQLLPKEKSSNCTGEEKKKKLLIERTDCFIIPLAPRENRDGKAVGVKSSSTTNSHILVTFGMTLCLNLLKREKIKDSAYREYVDPFVQQFRNCLSSQHVKLNTVALKCLIRVLKYDLPSVKENIEKITEDVFNILHKYAVSGLNKGDNFDLVIVAFKFVAVLLREVKYYTINTEQLKMLLLYAEQDLHENGRQTNALALLKAITSRKLISPEIFEVMRKVAEMSITSELPQVRQYCRQVFLQFLMDYPVLKKLDSYIAFCISQLNYEYQSGRESALSMIDSFITSFPLGVLKKECGMFLIALGARLVNDDAPKCRKMIAASLAAMFSRLPGQQRDLLFDMILLWFKDKQINHRKLAAQLCGIFITVEKSSFESRMPSLLPIILSQFQSHDDLSISLQPEGDTDADTKKRIKDHYLFQLLQILLKLCSNCPSFFNREEEFGILASYVQSLLGYPHEWVRLASAQFLGFVLSSLDIDRLIDIILLKKTEDAGYLYSDPVSGIKSLTLDLCAQLQIGITNDSLAEQVVKNLVFIARILEKVPHDIEENLPNLSWLAKRMRKISNTELVRSPTSTVLRAAVFKWIAGVVVTLDKEQVLSILPNLLPVLVREMVTADKDKSALKQLSKEVGILLKKHIGDEVYASEFAKAQQQLTLKQAERKRTSQQMAVVDAELHAKKKIKKNIKKKESKKKKLAVIKGKPRKGKKRKFDEIECDTEVK